MQQLMLAAEAATHQTYAVMLGVADRFRAERPDDGEVDRDRGAVSLEQVLWFAAAGISVAVIATILYNRIFAAGRDTVITPPAAPTGG